MNTVFKIVAILIVSAFLIMSGYAAFLFSGFSNEANEPEPNEPQPNETTDTIPPRITSVTGDIMADAGTTLAIRTTFSDNAGVTAAKLYYRPATADAWSSKSILSQTATLDLPVDSTESWYYYVTVNDAAGNGPIGDPSSDGSSYYTIMVMNTYPDPQDDNDSNDSGPHNNQSTTRFVFLELGTKIVCSECPKISLIMNELYNAGNYPFYYVSMPQDNPKAMERLNEYNIWGYPTVYIDGGVSTLIGSTIQKSDFEKNIIAAAARNTSHLVINTTAQWNNLTNRITVDVRIVNLETSLYTGQLRVYITELISTKWQAGTPMHFSLLDFLINEQVEIQANDEVFLTKTLDASDIDPENLMLFSVLFNKEKTTQYSQPPDKNPYDAHTVDAISATRVIQGGNLPPEVGIENPSVKYFHRFGKPIRKSFTGNTVLLGKTTIIASVHDDSKIEKVEFYLNSKLMTTLTKEPYEWIWHKFTFGKKIISVTAYDDAGKTATASITVKAFML